MSILVVLEVLVVVTTWPAAVWKLRQARLRPGNHGAALLAAFFTVLAISLTGLAWPASGNGLLEPWLGTNANVMVRNLLLIPAFGLGHAFLLYASGYDTRRRRFFLLAAPAGLWAVTTVASWYTIPEHLRYAPITDTSEPGRVVYYVVGMLGLTYFMGVLGTTLTYLNARGADSTTRRGLLISCGAFAASLVVFSFPRLLAIPLHNAALAALGETLGLCCLGLAAIGLAWPTGHARLAAARVWNRHRRLASAIHPLWTAVSRAFPQYVMNHDNYQGRRVMLRVHHCFYRRVVECRDGLLLAARALAAQPQPTSLQEEAALLRPILEGPTELKRGRPGPILAAPDGDSVEDDARALAALAAELHR